MSSGFVAGFVGKAMHATGGNQVSRPPNSAIRSEGGDSILLENRNILVTGGAGYIGSHVVRQLVEAGAKVTTLDDLSTGFCKAVLGAKLVVGDVGNQRLLGELLTENRIDTVMHFAAHTAVSESVADPMKYYFNNTDKSRNLLACCHQHGVRNFVFSSTAAVYGIPADGLASEDAPTLPINPYGRSKLMTEWMLKDLAKATDLKYIILRYFNVAGSDPATRIGQSTHKATLLIKVACEVATGKRDHISIFGTDYPTPDGTGIRDFIHVEDLADAHLRSLGYLYDGGESKLINVGYGHGYSVRQVLRMVEEVAGKKIKIVEQGRRSGDPPMLIADTSRIREVLHWQPKYDDLRAIVDTALKWEHKVLDMDPYGE